MADILVYNDRLWKKKLEYTVEGIYDFTLPSGEYLLRCNGASGGRGVVGDYRLLGGTSLGVLNLNSQQSFHAFVGGNGGDYSLGSIFTGTGGFNGGGNGGYRNHTSYRNGAGGGGASDIRLYTKEELIPSESQGYIPEIPTGYKQVEYIESDGTQYFDTGYIATENTTFTFSCSYTVSDSYVQGILGSQSDANTNPGWVIFLDNQNSSSYRRNSVFPHLTSVYGNKILSTSASYVAGNVSDYATNVIPGEKATYRVDKWGAYVNEIPISYNSDVTGSPDNRSVLFLSYRCGDNESPTWAPHEIMVSKFRGKIYFLRIYEFTNDEYNLVREFIPVVRESDNEYGLYDTCTHTFITTANSTTFTNHGDFGRFVIDDVALSHRYYPTIPDEYTQIEYVQTNGSQFFDSEYVANRYTTITARVIHLGGTEDNVLFGSQSATNTNPAWIVWYFQIPTRMSSIFGNMGYSSSYDRIMDIVQGDSALVRIDSHMGYSGLRRLYGRNADGEPDTRSILICDSWRGSSLSGYGLKGKLHHFRCYEPDPTTGNYALIHEFVPCIRNSDNLAGLYDTVPNPVDGTHLFLEPYTGTEKTPTTVTAGPTGSFPIVDSNMNDISFHDKCLSRKSNMLMQSGGGTAYTFRKLNDASAYVFIYSNDSWYYGPMILSTDASAVGFYSSVTGTNITDPKLTFTHNGYTWYANYPNTSQATYDSQGGSVSDYPMIWIEETSSDMPSMLEDYLKDFLDAVGDQLPPSESTYELMSLGSRIIVAGGGGGYSVGDSNVTNNEHIQHAGIGGGAVAGPTAPRATEQKQYATQSSGYSFGVGQEGGGTGSAPARSGGGGGWFGGYAAQTANANSCCGGGGSGYVLTESSYKSPYVMEDYQQYELTNTLMTSGSAVSSSVTVYEPYDMLRANDHVEIIQTGTGQHFTLPAGEFVLKCWGGDGGVFTGLYDAARGGYAQGTLNILSPVEAHVYVAGSGLYGDMISSEYTQILRPDIGFNGGGLPNGYGTRQENTYSYGGGGGTDIRLGDDSLFSRVIVAGGAGGQSYYHKNGGAGGGESGVIGDTGDYVGGITPGPGTQTESPKDPAVSQINGGFGYGGSTPTVSGVRGAAGAGGGGWFGGSSTYNTNSSRQYARGGCGGSGYVLTNSSYKPDGYKLDSRFYLTNTQNVQGGNNLPVGISKAEIDVVRTITFRILCKDMYGVKYYNESSSRWELLEDQEIGPTTFMTYGSLMFSDDTGLADIYEVLVYDPGDNVSAMSINVTPNKQRVVHEMITDIKINDMKQKMKFDPSVYSVNIETRRTNLPTSAKITTTIDVEKNVKSNKTVKMYYISYTDGS